MAMDFLMGGLAGVGAGFFSNPFDVVKTRMQLQGELRARGQHTIHYRNIPHAMYTIVKHDGLSSLQKGLSPALCFQMVVNGTRLGVYQHADNFGLLRNEQGQTKMVNSFVMGAVAGCLGGFCGSPLQMVKTQLMSDSSDKIAVGTQHKHSGVLYALNKIYSRNGIYGLWRGAQGGMLRNGTGSSSQIAAFALSKEWMDENGYFEDSKYMSAVVASNIGAIFKTILMTPIDVVVTRMYNQATNEKGQGLMYDNLIDCTRKIARAEGPLAFYKGLGPSYLRQAPHTVLLLVFWDMLKDFQTSFVEKS